MFMEIHDSAPSIRKCLQYTAKAMNMREKNEGRYAYFFHLFVVSLAVRR